MAQISQLNIRRGEVIPDLTLPNRQGYRVSTRDAYLRRNLVLAVLPRKPEPGWSAWVQRLGDAVQQIPDGDALTLLVTPPEMDAGLRAAVDELPASVRAVLDERNLVEDRYGAIGAQGLLVVADLYGVAFVIESGGPNDEEMDPAGIPDWVEFIACQC